MILTLYNTKSRKVEPFIPLTKGKVGLYCCGPTVYQYAHIGNFRAYVIQDLLKRALRYAGYQVRHVMNITDIGHLVGDGDEGEDKVLRTARERGMSVQKVAQFFTEAFETDARKLKIIEPDVTCRASDHIDQMISMIQLLQRRGYTYRVGGNVYYDTKLFPDYGKMALLDRAGGERVSRVEKDDNKRHPQDFVLWFTKGKYPDQAMKWASPWGEGYPGWHIECSAMSRHYLGDSFDIHCGGIDHVPVHHTNEIAQTEGATGVPGVRYWVHNEFLLMKRGKISKSAGNTLTLTDLEKQGFSALDFRYFLLGAHYRSQQIFHFEALEGAKRALDTLRERLKEATEGEKGREFSEKDLCSLPWWGEFEKHMLTDLNFPQCLAALWGLMKDRKISDGLKVAAARRMDEVLGLDLFLEQNRSLSEELQQLIDRRQEARSTKDFQLADEIRDTLAQRGVLLEDTQRGTKWRWISNVSPEE